MMSLLVRPVRFALPGSVRRSFAAITISKTSTTAEVCDWGRSGVGLDEDDVAVLRREKIKGTSLFNLTDEALKEDGMSRGARMDLLAAVARLREPQASLQPAVPFLADVPWAYQESSEVADALREGLLLRHAAWETRSADNVYRADKRSHPVFTVYAGPGSGKSRLLSELPRLALAAVRDNADLARLLNPSLAYVFHVGFENGTAYQNSERDGAAAVANRMMWQLVRPIGVTHGFASFAACHAYRIEDALDKLSELTGRPRVDQPVFLLVDGMHNLCANAVRPPSVFDDAVKAVSTVVCGEQFIVGAIAATSGLQLETLFGASKQARVFLRPPALQHPELVVPDDPSFPALSVLRDDMGGHGRALDILANLVQARKTPGRAQSIEALSAAVQSKLRLDFSDWMSVQPLEKLLEAVVSRRPFKSLNDVVVEGISVDKARELGLIQWAGSLSAPGPLIAPVILLLMLQSNLPGDCPLACLATGYNKIEFGSRSGNWWQDFEEFAAVFRAIKARAFRGIGWVSVAQLHYGARLSPAAQSLLIRTPASTRDVFVIAASEQYQTKSSARVRSVVPWVTPAGRVRHLGAPVDISDGASVVLNGVSASAGDVFLDVEVNAGGITGSSRTCREVFACRHREADVSAADFARERDKAADEGDLFIFFTTKKALVDLSSTALMSGEKTRRKRSKTKPADISASLVGFVDASCFEAYFGFGGRSFADAEARSAAGSRAHVVSIPDSTRGLAAAPADGYCTPGQTAVPGKCNYRRRAPK